MNRMDALSFVGDGTYTKQTVEALLDQMDRLGVQKTLVAPDEACVAVENEAGNQAMLAASRAWPDRLLAYAVANPWYGGKAVKGLQAALQAGARAVYFHAALQGFAINDPIVDPLIEVCEHFDVPAYFHTGTPAYALPFHLHYLARRFPRVRFIMGHSGANDFVADALPALFERDNIWLDTSLNLTVTLSGFFQQAPDRLVFASSAPVSTLQHELDKVYRARPSDEQLRQVFFDNLCQVLGAKP